MHNVKPQTTVLIADDEEYIRSVLRGFLEDQHRIIEAEDGAVALDLLKSEKIDLVISDMIMPKNPGLDLLSYVNREELGIRVSSQLNKNWSAFVRHRRDIRADESRFTAMGLTFKNDCCLVELVGERKFFKDRELDQEDSIFVRIVFKHLGEVGNR